MTSAAGVSVEASVEMCGADGAVHTFEACGAPPASDMDGFEWSIGRLIRATSTRMIPHLPVLWHGAVSELLSEDGNEHASSPDGYSWRWTDNSGHERENTYLSLVGKALHDLAGQAELGLRCVCVENTMQEAALDRLLEALKQAGNTSVELLWRSVAIALGLIRSGVDVSGISEGMLVLDFGATALEVTFLETRRVDGLSVPLRRAYRPDIDGIEGGGLRCTGVSWRRIADGLAAKVGRDVATSTQLVYGPFGGRFLEWASSGRHSSTWVFSDDRLSSVALDENVRQDAYRDLFASEEWVSVACEAQEFCRARGIMPVVHGLDPSVRDVISGLPHVIHAPAHAASQGCLEYFQRLASNSPTYLEALPQVSIVSRIEETNALDFIEIISEGEYMGGHQVRVKPIKRFRIEAGMSEFPIIVSRSDWEGVARKVDLAIPETGGEIPIVLNAELKPGQGHVKLWIEGAEDHEDAFGEERRIYLDWQEMEEFELTPYAGPSTYPCEGRIFDADDPGIIQAVRQMVHEVGDVEQSIEYKGHNVRFSKILAPWGFRTPWHTVLNKPTRGIFGPAYRDDAEVQRLSKQLAEIIDNTANVHGMTNNRHKYLNYMFVYTPERFLEELRSIYGATNPPIASWNTAYAPGRVFSTAKDFEILLDAMIRMSKESGWPSHPKDSYTTKYFWSFFRCLCYYDETAQVPPAKVEAVLEQVRNYVRDRNGDGWIPQEGEHANVDNAKKFCLFAILFSCRMRERRRSFVTPGSDLNDAIAGLISAEQMGPVSFPQTMIGVVPPETLNDYVLRFWLNEAGESDINLLSGLVTSIS